MTAKLVRIDYTNWRGERSERLIQPLSIEFSSNEWHPDPQWLLFALDVAKQDTRTFAMAMIHDWIAAEDSK